MQVSTRTPATTMETPDHHARLLARYARLGTGLSTPRARGVLRRAVTTVLMTGLFAVVPPCSNADTFLVTDVIDAIPAPVGSLRWAIEQSELNGVPDRILFVIDGGTIRLVAPLPDLLEGSLSIGDATLADVAGGPLPSPGIFVDGAGVIPRALAIRSSRNAIGELQFTGFAGTEVLLVEGGVVGNTVARCVFGDDGGLLSNSGAGVRIVADPLGVGVPSETLITRSRFVGNHFGVVIEGNPSSPGINAGGTDLLGNGFGTNAQGDPGSGTGRAISAANGGPVRIVANRFSGPGQGILLGAGTARSVVTGNRIGLLGSTGVTPCSGYTGAAVEADGGRVAIEENTIRCSQVGISLGAQANATVRANVIGGESPAGHASHGIALSASARAAIEKNTIFGNGGWGVATIPDTIGTPTDGPLITCNGIWRNGLGALDLPNATTTAPTLLAATPIRVEGQTMNLPGWAEIFGDDVDQARVFQGAVRPGAVDPSLMHLIPVLDLRVVKGATGAAISFDREAPAAHTATYTAEGTMASSELALPIASDSAGLVFDLIRGNVGNLAFQMTGTGIDLGPVTCLASAMSPDIVISPTVIDPLDPPSGESFFYLSRRRELAANRPGTYDPALCLSRVDGFGGPRRPASGDCQ